MPSIRSSTDLRNNYNEISAYCHDNREPVFITKNGHGDLAVMSIDTYEMLLGRHELYQLLESGRTAINENRKRPLSDVLSEVRQELNNGKL